MLFNSIFNKKMIIKIYYLWILIKIVINNSKFNNNNKRYNNKMYNNNKCNNSKYNNNNKIHMIIYLLLVNKNL